MCDYRWKTVELQTNVYWSRLLRCAIPHAPIKLFLTSLYLTTPEHPLTAHVVGEGTLKFAAVFMGGISTIIGTEKEIDMFFSPDSAFVGSLDVEIQRYITGFTSSWTC